VVGSTLTMLMSPSGKEVELVCGFELSVSAVEKRLLEEVFFSNNGVLVVLVGVLVVVLVVVAMNAEVWEKRMQKMDNFMLLIL